MRSHRGTGGRASRRLILLVIAAAVALGAGAASHSTASTQQTIPHLTLAIQATVDNLDAARQANGYNWTTEGYGVEPLVVVAPDGTVKPWLAQSVQNPNPFTYIYNLRKGVKFWDGTELTAADAANALNYYRFKEFNTSAYLGYPAVRSITAPSRYKVVVTLKQRNAAWQYTPAVAGWIFQKKFQQQHGSSMGKPGVLTMGTGPWKYDSLDPTRGVELSANPRYWRGKVPIQRLSIKFIADPTNQALAFRAGDIDIANNLADPRGFVAAAPGSLVKTYPSCGVLHMSMNTKVGPWANIHVRRAAAYATNRADIIKAGGGPLVGSPAYTLIDPSLLRPLVPKAQADKFFKSLNTYRFNLAKAKQELSQSPYPNGFSSTLSSLPFGLYPQIMQAFAGDLAKIGIKIDVKVKTIGEWFAETTGDKNKVPLFFDGTECNSPFPGTTPDSFVYGKNVAEGKFNTANYTNPRVDALLDSGKTVINRAKSFAIYSQLLTILSRDVPYIPLYVANESYAFSSKYAYPQKSLYDVGMVDRTFLLNVKPK